MLESDYKLSYDGTPIILTKMNFWVCHQDLYCGINVICEGLFVGINSVEQLSYSSIKLMNSTSDLLHI